MPFITIQPTYCQHTSPISRLGLSPTHNLASVSDFICILMEGKVIVEQQPKAVLTLSDGNTPKTVKDEGHEVHLPNNNDESLLNKTEEEEDGDERKKVVLMRSLVEKQNPSSKEFDDLMIRRFLRARDRDIEKASAMFLKYLKWKSTFVPNGSISASEIPNEIAQDKMFLQGIDKIGRPITLLFGNRHCPNKKGGLDEFKRFVVFALDKICSRMPTGQEKFVGIGDLEGWGYSNSDIRGYLAALSILQDYHPERLGKLYIVHAPYLFMKVWKVIYPFIDNNTKKKVTFLNFFRFIVFAENKKLKATLLEDIDESQLPEIYGGKMKLISIHES